MIYGTIPRRHNYGVLEHPGVKTLNIYKNRPLFFSNPASLLLNPPPHLSQDTYFFLSCIKIRKTFWIPGGMRGLGEIRACVLNIGGRWGWGDALGLRRGRV